MERGQQAIRFRDQCGHAEACRPGFASCLVRVRSLFGPLCVSVCVHRHVLAIAFRFAADAKSFCNRYQSWLFGCLWELSNISTSSWGGTPAENNGRRTLLDRSIALLLRDAGSRQVRQLLCQGVSEELVVLWCSTLVCAVTTASGVAA